MRSSLAKQGPKYSTINSLKTYLSSIQSVSDASIIGEDHRQSGKKKNNEEFGSSVTECNEGDLACRILGVSSHITDVLL